MKIDWKKEIKLSRPSLKRPKVLSAGPSIKLPRPVTDLYADLRDRHLLPLVAVLIVAIVAAPILLNDKSETKQPTVAPIAGSSTGGGSMSSFTVVPAARRLRSPGRRLAHRQALDPFRVEAKESHESKGSGATSGTEGTSSSSGVESGDAEVEAPVAAPETYAPETAAPVTEAPSNKEVTITESATGEKEMTITESGSSTTPPSGAAAESAGTEGAVVAYTVDMKSGVLPGELTEQADVAPMTKLPTDKNPLVVFVGLSQDGKRGLFLMTSKVTAYYGPVHCVVDQQACQMVELKPGNAAIFAYGLGEEEARYKVVLQKIEPATGTGATVESRARSAVRNRPAPRADALSAARRFSK